MGVAIFLTFFKLSQSEDQNFLYHKILPGRGNDNEMVMKVSASSPYPIKAKNNLNLDEDYHYGLNQVNALLHVCFDILIFLNVKKPGLGISKEQKNFL